MQKEIHSGNLTIERKETNFDKACDEANSLVLMRLGSDDSGHLTKVPGSNRSTDHILLKFVSYEATMCMSGPNHMYNFNYKVLQYNE